ncbi:MAG: zf-HC2 domain-containing protein [Erysipelotrichaceae bacterium]|nr:zf-HC2 domain-containing protein [Erysipelotrichaceae bacterium]
MKMHCDVIQDLIPSYLDEICSEKTKELVEEHLLECEQCRMFVESLKTDFIPEIPQIDAKKPWLKVKRHSLMKMILVFVVSPFVLLSVFVTGCTLSGEGLTLDALLYQDEANEFLQALSLSDYAEASQYLSCFGADDVSLERAEWTLRMEESNLEFSNMQYSPLWGVDGLAMTRVTAVLSTGELIEFRLMVQGNGLSVSSVYVYGNDELQEYLQDMMTSHNPG